MSRTLLIQGYLNEGCWGEADDILLLETGEPRDEKQPVAEILDDTISRKQVTARYWITEQKCTKEDADEFFMRCAMGLADTKFNVWYSEITGYLWTDEEAKIGGHDLIEEFKSHIGKYLILEIDVHDQKA